MVALIITLVFFGLVLWLFTHFNRRNKTEETEITINNDGECCGAHEVCDMDTLLTSSEVIEYFEDEELDELADMDPKDLNDKQMDQLLDVFYTLKENEVAAWLRSLQLRRIQLPIELREQALMIVSERRGA